MSTIGERVCAISHTSEDGKTVYIFGYGIYEGDAIPEAVGGEMAQMLRDANITNPKIVLDSGKVVYGCECECWYGPEETVKASFEKHGQTTEVIDIDETRAKHAAAEATEAPKLEDEELVEIVQTIEGDYPELAGIKKIFEMTLSGCVGIEQDLIVPAVSIEMLNTFGYLQSKGSIKRVTNFEVRLDTIGQWNETNQDWDTIPEVEVSMEFVLPNENSEATDERKVGLSLTLKKLATETLTAHPPSVE